MSKTDRYRDTLIVIAIFLIAGLAELIAIYYKFGGVLIQNRMHIVNFMLKTYLIYAFIGAFCGLLSKYFLSIIRKISFIKRSESIESFIAIAVSTILALIGFVYVYNNIAEHPFDKKGIQYFLLIFLCWIILSIILRYSFVFTLKMDRIRRYLLTLGSINGQVALIALYLIAGLAITMNTETKADLSSSKKPNILLISVDTLRQDRLSCYGNKKIKTKNIDQLAADGILFENNFSTDYWTLPTHASIFTSLNPEVHGTYKLKKIDQALTTFPEILSKNGYLNVATVDTDPMGYVGAKRGFDQGFKYYSHYPIVINPIEHLLMTKVYKILIVPFQVEHSSSMVSSLIKWQDRRNTSPLFYFLHIYDVHHDENLISQYLGYPYFPHEPYATELLGDKSKWSSLIPKGKGGSIYLNEVNDLFWNDKNYNGPSTDQIGLFSDLYDCGVAHVDEQLGKLFSDMRKKGLYDNSIIILTADHGEEFYEHKQMQHIQPYDECLRVPLIIKPAKANIRNKKINGLTSIFDFAQTIL